MEGKQSDEWVTSKVAAEILTQNKTGKNQKAVSDAYVRGLALEGKITTMVIDARTKLYSRKDCEAYIVGEPGRRGSGQPRVRKSTATGRPTGRPRKAKTVGRPRKSAPPAAESGDAKSSSAA